MMSAGARQWLTAVLLAATAAFVGDSPRAAQTAPTIDLVDASIPQLQSAMRSGALTAHALVEAYLRRIEAYDRQGPAVNALISINPHAVALAEALDAERRQKGPRGPLHGIPLIVSDNYETAEMPTTFGSRVFEGFATGRDAFQVRRLREAGAVILAKANVHELGLGSATRSSLGGQTRNPYDLLRIPGGASGGAAAAVASSLAAAALATDACGDVRIPAAHNNLFGLRVTFGLSSRTGTMPSSRSEESVGLLTRTANELALLLAVTTGPDADDPITQRQQVNPRAYQAAMGDSSLSGIRIGVLSALFGTEPADDEVAAAAHQALERLNQMGAEVFDVSVPDLLVRLEGTSPVDSELKFDFNEYLAGHVAAPFRSLAGILDSGRYQSDVEPHLRRAEMATARDSVAGRLVQERRNAIRDDIVTLMTEQRLDAIAYPPVRRVAAFVGDEQRGSNCQLAAATGLPALSMPAGFTTGGLPVAVELLGAPFREPRLLTIAYAYEQSVRPRRPPATTPELTR
jgi:Asp-tRNA(Asn)/Glu-tRNA(Gln) amidotransferase A subunit family amidase